MAQCRKIQTQAATDQRQRQDGYSPLASSSPFGFFAEALALWVHIREVYLATTCWLVT